MAEVSESELKEIVKKAVKEMLEEYFPKGKYPYPYPPKKGEEEGEE